MPRKKRRFGVRAPRRPDDAPPPPTDESTPEGEAARTERRARQRREWAEQKRREERALRSHAPFIWIGGVAAVLAAAVIGGIFLFAGGDDNGSVPEPTPTPDRRIAGLPIDATLTVNMDDDGQAINPRFEPATLTARAGQVIEILAVNAGSVPHNIRLAGRDGEYDLGAPTSDDWVTAPEAVEAGETGRLVLKIDEPGSYQFRCDFHPTQQTGVLILN